MTLAVDRQRRRGDGRLVELGVGLAIVLLVAALTHLVAILLIPHVATEDAYHVLAARSGLDKTTMLASSRPGDRLIPFRDPATVQGVVLLRRLEGADPGEDARRGRPASSPCRSARPRERSSTR